MRGVGLRSERDAVFAKVWDLGRHELLAAPSDHRRQEFGAEVDGLPALTVQVRLTALAGEGKPCGLARLHPSRRAVERMVTAEEMDARGIVTQVRECDHRGRVASRDGRGAAVPPWTDHRRDGLLHSIQPDDGMVRAALEAVRDFEALSAELACGEPFLFELRDRATGAQFEQRSRIRRISG